MALPPYLRPDPEVSASDRPAPWLRRDRRFATVIVVVAVLSAGVGALIAHTTTSRETSSAAKNTTTTNPPVATTFVDPTGQSVSVAGWLVRVNDFHVVDAAAGRSAPQLAHELVVQLSITNSGRRARMFFAPDQIELVYLTPALDQQPNGFSCDTGFCERSTDAGGTDNPIPGGRTVHWRLAFSLPKGSNGFRLVVRPSLHDEQRAGQAGLINLSCC